MLVTAYWIYEFVFSNAVINKQFPTRSGQQKEGKMKKVIMALAVLWVFGCTNTVVAPTSRAPQDRVVKAPQKEVPSETSGTSRILFTPLIALEAVLSEPLEFVGNVNLNKHDLYYPICIWQNGKVLIRTDFCSADSKERSVDVYIYSPDGQMVSFYYEVKDENQTKGIVIVRYADFSSFKGVELLSLSSMTTGRYIKFNQLTSAEQEEKGEGVEAHHYPYCREAAVVPEKKPDHYTPWSEYPLGMGCWEMSKVDTEKIAQIGNQFLHKTPPEQWYTFLGVLEKKYIEHDFR